MTDDLRAALDAALSTLDPDDLDYRTDPARPTALEPNEPELWVPYERLRAALSQSSETSDPDRADPPTGTPLTDAEVQVVYAAFDRVNATEAQTVEGRREIVEPLYEAFIAVRNARILRLLATPEIGRASAEPRPDRADPKAELPPTLPSERLRGWKGGDRE